MINAGLLLGMTYPRATGGGGTVPVAPTIGTASVAGENTLSVTFTPNGDGGSPILSYTAVASPGNISQNGASSPISIAGLTPGTAYTITVTANNAIGSSASSAASNSVTCQGKPNAPTGLSGTAGSGQVTISFTPPANNGGSAITGYTVTSSPGGITASGASSPITVTGLTNGTAYTFTAVATNAYGNSVSSAVSPSYRPVAPGNSGPFDSLYTAGWMPITDQVVRTPGAQSIPAKSTGVSSPSFTDANYGTKIFRVSQLTDSPNNGSTRMRHEYSRRQPYNCDNTKFLLQNSSGFYFCYDASTFAVIDGGVTTADAKNKAVGTNSIQLKDPRDWTWHPTDPNKVIFFSQNDGLILYQYDIATKTLTTKANFTGRLGMFGSTVTKLAMLEGRCSDDARYWGWQVFNGSTTLGYMTWDMNTDTITGTLVTSASANNTTMSPSGNYIVISASGAGLTFAQCAASSTIRGTRAYTRDFSSFKQIHLTTTHMDVGYDLAGNEVMVSLNPGSSSWTDVPQNSLFYIPLSGPSSATMLLNLGTHSTQWNSHYSCTSAPGRPGYTVLSMWDSAVRGTRKWLDYNICLIELKPSPTVYRLWDSRSLRYTYWQEPHTCLSRDGLRIMTANAWDATSSSTPALEYMIGLPSWLYGGGGPAPLLTFPFDNSTGWTVASGCSITGGKLWCNNTLGNSTNSYATTVLPAGTYDVQYTISDFNAGNVTMRINVPSVGVFSGVTRSAGVDPAGTYTDRITISAACQAFEVRATRQGTAMDFKVDDITVTPVP